jgi:isopropylmalate/homocitrate/citramalate synthase
LNSERAGLSPGKFDVSPHNFVGPVLSQYAFPQPLRICDSTIRKMDNTPGSKTIRVADKLAVARALVDAGVYEIGFNPMHFYGTPRNDSIVAGMEAVVAGALGCEISAILNWSAFRDNNVSYHIDRIIGLGATVIEVETPGSEQFRQMYTPWWDWSAIERDCAAAVDYIRAQGCGAGVVIPDLPRADASNTARRMSEWMAAGAGRFRLADSFGSLAPEAVKHVFQGLRQTLDAGVTLIYHVHDDFGLATSQSIAAASSGAWPDVSVNGIGERSFADFAQVVLSLELLYGISTGIQLDRLVSLSRLVEDLTGIEVQPHRPVVGATMFVPLFEEEYLALLAGGSYQSSAYDPALVGSKPSLVWWEGMLSTQTIAAKLNAMGLAPLVGAEAALDAVRARLGELSRFPVWLTDEEVSLVCSELAGAATHPSNPLVSE